MNLTDDDVQEILRILEQSPYGELKLETDRFSIEIKATGDGFGSADTAAVAAGESESAATDVRVEVPAGEIVEIRPPLPGTFYRAPSPGAEPFTEVGKTVDESSVLGLVETMKLMNSVVAGCRGEVLEICIENGTMVEKEDVLIRIKASGNG